MNRTANFRKQHDDILMLVKDITAALRSTLSEEDAARLRAMLAQLSGKLSVHLAMEDKSFYPTLVGSADPELQRIARQYSSEMGPLASTFQAYVQKWSTARVIHADPAGFSSDTRTVFGALTARIQKENTHLYHLADKLA